MISISCCLEIPRIRLGIIKISDTGSYSAEPQLFRRDHQDIPRKAPSISWQEENRDTDTMVESRLVETPV